jgi:molecular chaperone DnaK
MKLGEAIYKAQAEAAETETPGEEEPRPVDDDVVDAEFEDLDENDKRK